MYQQRGFVLAKDDRFLRTLHRIRNMSTAMVKFIEEEFGIHVSSCEITKENLDFLCAVARFVEDRQPFAIGLPRNVQAAWCADR